jgi:hypothetical protein
MKKTYTTPNILRYVSTLVLSLVIINNLFAQTVKTYGYADSLQSYRVPEGIHKIVIETFGAQGKSTQEGQVGGLGARMKGTFAVNPGDHLLLLVGGEGVSPGGGSGGGGGGSFVVKLDPLASDTMKVGPYAGKTVTPLIIAGGGGGTRDFVFQDGNPGMAYSEGSTGSCIDPVGGGDPNTSALGSGGASTCNSWGSGGGGFRGDGADDFTWGTGGKSFLNGGGGGTMSCGEPGVYGGYGGGGSGGGCWGGGGGGGYTGGDGGRLGGGGGSYNIGTDQDNASGVQSGHGSITITYENTSTGTKPIITTPSNITMNVMPNLCGTTVSYNATAVGNPTPVLTYFPASGSIFPVGTTQVMVVASNDVGNDTSSFEVEVIDHLKPHISCLPNITTYATAHCSANITWATPLVTENCHYTLSSNFHSGDHFPIGNTTVTYIAQDDAHNADTCSFIITVMPTTMNGFVAIKSYQGGTAISCFGKMDGEATVNMEGGCMPYTYCWNTSPMQSTKTASHLGAGTYTVKVKDANGQSLTLRVTLNQPTPLVAEAGNDAMTYSGYAPLSCASLSGSATGGNGNYSFAWSNGIQAASTSVCPSISTTYTLTVVDANACEASDQVYVCVTDVSCAKGGNAMDTAGQKVMICHKAGNKFQTLCVGTSSVKAHLAHGDQLGDCNISYECLNTPHNNGRKIAEANEEKEKNTQRLADETNTLNQFNAHPNPFSALTTISFTAFSNDLTTVEIINMKGELITSPFNKPTIINQLYNFELDGSTWTDGIYLARITSANQMQYLKLVLSH